MKKCFLIISILLACLVFCSGRNPVCRETELAPELRSEVIPVGKVSDMNIEASAALEPYTAPLPVEDHANDNSMLNEQYRTETKVANVNNPIDAGSKPKNGSSGSTGKTNNTTEVNAANVNNLNDTVSKSDSGSSRRTDIVSDTAEEKASEPVVYVGQTGYDPYELPED